MNFVMEEPVKKEVTPAASKKYDGKSIRWVDKADYYELIFADDFVSPSSSMEQGVSPGLMTDILLDMKEADKNKPLHVFVGSYGGAVPALTMILQQVLCFKHRTAISLGYACSCGWMLLFSCPTRYVTPYSMNLYHSMSTLCYGKVKELTNLTDFHNKWYTELIKNTDTEKFLTKEELKLGETSEVWFTGRELIERGAAYDYKFFVNPPAIDTYKLQELDGKYYALLDDGAYPCRIDRKKSISKDDYMLMLDDFLNKEMKGKLC